MKQWRDIHETWDERHADEMRSLLIYVFFSKNLILCQLLWWLSMALWYMWRPVTKVWTPNAAAKTDSKGIHLSSNSLNYFAYSKTNPYATNETRRCISKNTSPYFWQRNYMCTDILQNSFVHLSPIHSATLLEDTNVYTTNPLLVQRRFVAS